MSVSSYSSASSSSSSSGSSSSSLSSSSGASFSSSSTIVAPQPVIRPFGCPEYNYFWIENKSKTNPKKSYYYNYKSHCVVWQRPLPKDVPLPFYANYRAPGQKNLLIEDDKDLVLSDSEDEVTKRKRLALKRRNRRLAHEEKDESIQIVSIKKTVKSRRMLDTVWKLYRFPGESLNDVKKRFLDTSKSTITIKAEPNNECNLQNYDNIPIKSEPCFNNDQYNAGIEAANKTIKLMEDDSDSDPDNVSFLIKQENMMTYDFESDSELENRNDEEEIPEELYPTLEDELKAAADDLHPNSENEIESESDSMEDEEEYDNIKREPDFDMTNTSMPVKQELLSDFEDFEYDYEAPFLLTDYFDIEIKEDDGDSVFIPPVVDSMNTDSVEEDINWTFEKTSNTQNCALKQEVLNPLYNAPKLKKISKKHLLKEKQKRKRSRPKRKPVPKVVIKKEPDWRIKKEPVWHIKKEPEVCDPDAPIICDMYGTRTINYNHPPKVKIPRWQSCSKLSESDNSEREFEIYKVKKEQEVPSKPNQETVTNDTKPTPSIKTEPGSALELRNWFPKRRNKKRPQRSRKKSDSSWCESNLSDLSDVDDLLVAQMRMKREKRSTSPESNKESDSELEDIVPPKRIKIEKKEARSPPPTPPPTPAQLPSESITLAVPDEMESKIERPTTPLLVDLSIVKVERRSSDEYVDNDDIVILKREDNKPDIHAVDLESGSSSSSSSSSCTCSRSSCSCRSSSSSSSSDEEDGTADKEAKKEDL